MKKSKTTFDADEFLARLTSHSGVYRMLDENQQILYIGKAKNLKKRVSTYFQRALNRRIQQMVSQIANIEITVTNTEAEALILENTLIKTHAPKYNILLRDGKGYPYIFISDDTYPRLSSHRGARKAKGQYFGPYPSVKSVKATLDLLQKIFPIRQCENSYYAARSRACLQYQIKRCSAPCVKLIRVEDYAKDVQNTADFLRGKTQVIQKRLVKQMEMAADELHFEQAALYRDQIQALQQIQEKQYVSNDKGDLDIIACALESGSCCIQLFFIRGGRNLGNKVFYPKVPTESTIEQVISAFIARHYFGKQAIKELLVSHLPDDHVLLEEILSEQWQQPFKISEKVRGTRAKWLQIANKNAEFALKSHLASKKSSQAATKALAKALGIKKPLKRMECYDISHTSGERTVASCVVFNENGAVKADYRRFNIKNITAGDDYAAMAQVLTRRYQRIIKEDGKMPDILFIDGGRGQLSAVVKVLKPLGVLDDLMLVAVAKGADRKAGLEQLFLRDQATPIILPSHSPALRIIQQIRDESHRFAITGHRLQRAKVRKTSTLEHIAGIGAKRRQNLLRHFGGIQALKTAGVDDISKVQGISQSLAEKIYATFHAE